MDAEGYRAFSPTIKGVVFDMDGTLVRSPLDFGRIRREARVPDGVPILEFISGACAAERERARRVLALHERRAALECELQPSSKEVLSHLRRVGVKVALLTRNSRDSVRQVLARFGLLFDCWVAREDAPPKPSGEPVRRIARALGLHPSELLVVGDYVFDVQAGQAAGARTALLRTEKPIDPDVRPDIVLDDLADLLEYFPEHQSRQ